MLKHAPWGGPETVENAVALDAFAGTGALGLEALSRGARLAIFIERAPAALSALRFNIRICGADRMSSVIAADMLTLERQPGVPAAGLVFLDPPYGQGLVTLALYRLHAAGLIAPHALIVAETGWSEPSPVTEWLAERTHGAARLTIWRDTAS